MSEDRTLVSTKARNNVNNSPYPRSNMSKLPAFPWGTKKASSLEINARIFTSGDISDKTPEKQVAHEYVAAKPKASLSSVNAQAAGSLYQPLQPDEIRLIKLQPRIDESESIICSLVIARLQDAPEYIALSYVWGSEDDPATVQIDAVDFKVTRNLKDALVHLQTPNQERLFWVDALVINQSDISERNEQVPRMRDIYASAKSVTIWLGKGNSNLETLLGLITEVPGIIPDDPEKLDRETCFTWHETVNKWDPNASEFCMLHFNEFIQLPYFSRVWVTQEVAYASEAHVAYGENVAPYQQFYDFIHNMSKLTASTTSIFSGTKAYQNVAKDPGRMFLGPEPGSALKGDFMTMGAWLTACGNRSCTEPRDKVYGFYGCFPEVITDRIAVDYRKPVARVCLEMTKTIIKVSGCLLILDAVDDFLPVDVPLLGLPSWSPDYSHPTSLTAWDTQPQHFQLNPNPTYFRFSEHSQLLHVRGVHIGTVKATWCSNQIVIPRGFYPEHIPFDFTQLRITQCSEALQVRQEHLLGLLLNGGHTPPDDHLHKRLAFATNTSTGAVHIKAACTAMNCDYINRQWRERKIFTLDAANKAINAQEFQDSTFFTQPLGAANDIIKTGDAVYVFEGAHRYMVLRKYGVHYKIVCSGSLHGQDTSYIWTMDRLQGYILEEITLA